MEDLKAARERAHLKPGEQLSRTVNTSHGKAKLVRVSPYNWRSADGQWLFAWENGRWSANGGPLHKYLTNAVEQTLTP